MITAKQFLEAIKPGDEVYAALLIERFDSNRRSVGKHLWRLFHLGYLERTSTGHYKRTDKVWEKPPYTPRRKRAASAKPKQSESMQQFMPPVCIVEHAISRQHPLATIWGSANV